MSLKYAKDGYVAGAEPEMAEVLNVYKKTTLAKRAGVSQFFFRIYAESKPVPPSVKKKIIEEMERQLRMLDRALRLEKSN